MGDRPSSPSRLTETLGPLRKGVAPTLCGGASGDWGVLKPSCPLGPSGRSAHTLHGAGWTTEDPTLLPSSPGQPGRTHRRWPRTRHSSRATPPWIDGASTPAHLPSRGLRSVTLLSPPFRGSPRTPPTFANVHARSPDHAHNSSVLTHTSPYLSTHAPLRAHTPLRTHAHYTPPVRFYTKCVHACTVTRSPLYLYESSHF